MDLRAIICIPKSSLAWAALSCFSGILASAILTQFNLSYPLFFNILVLLLSVLLIPALLIYRHSEFSKARNISTEQNAERLALALKSAKIGMWSWDIVKNIIVFDDYMYHLYGREPGSFPLEFEKIINLMHPEDREAIKAKVAVTLKQGTEYETESRVIYPDNSLHYVYNRGRVYRDSEGKPLRLTGASWDVSDHKREEEEFKLTREVAEELAKEAARANHLKSEFLANMSHELRTPLNGIIGFTELLFSGKAGSLAPQQEEYMQDILSSSQHLLRLINDILDLSKIESGHIEFTPVPVNLKHLVAEVMETLSAVINAKKIALQVSIDPQVEHLVIDPTRLKQVLYNYLSNALKFSKERGEVKLLALPEENGKFSLIVKDAGIGIRPGDLKKLFVEFQQLDSSSQKKYPGTGLGLALVRRIVESQGGFVTVESVFGEGSTFTAVLPIKPVRLLSG